MRVVVAGTAGTAGLITARTVAGFRDHGVEIVPVAESPCAVVRVLEAVSPEEPPLDDLTPWSCRPSRVCQVQ
jgi:hypothetical protein